MIDCVVYVVDFNICFDFFKQLRTFARWARNLDEKLNSFASLNNGRYLARFSKLSLRYYAAPPWGHFILRAICSHLVLFANPPRARRALNYQNGGRGREFHETVENLSWASLKNGWHVPR